MRSTSYQVIPLEGRFAVELDGRVVISPLSRYAAKQTAKTLNLYCKSKDFDLGGQQSHADDQLGWHKRGGRH